MGVCSWPGLPIHTRAFNTQINECAGDETLVATLYSVRDVQADEGEENE